MSTRSDWIAERVPVSIEGMAAMSNEPVPYHLKRWWFALGGTPAYLFVVQIVTGILLAFYYQPSPATAYESVRYITEEAAFGWYLRGLHKWGATLMIAAVVLHQIRVFFTGAYRRPRELNWMIGMTLLVCTLLLGFTGYSLVFEQLSYWGATVGANISDTVPVVGPLDEADAARRRDLQRPDAVALLHPARRGAAGAADPGADDAHRPGAPARGDRARVRGRGATRRRGTSTSSPSTSTPSS